MNAFAYRATHPRVGGGSFEFGFTSRTLDLAETGAARDADLAALEDSCGARLTRMVQVHGDEVRVIAGEATTPVADGLVTRQAGRALLVRVADCVPVLIADPTVGVVAAVHAGRRGLLSGVVVRTLERLHELGAGDLVAWIGPHICPGCYEVPPQLREEVSEVAPQSWAETRWGTASIDLGAGVAQQLSAGGCRVERVHGCTFEDSTWPSYRRDGDRAGRMAGVIWMTEPGMTTSVAGGPT